MNQENDLRDILSLCVMPATSQTIKTFCNALFHAKLIDLDLGQCTISLKYINNPLRSNGYVQAVKVRKEWRFVILINLWPVCKKKSYSNAERYFYACATLCHELYHISLQIKGDSSRFDNYIHYIAFMEATNRFSKNYLVELSSLFFAVKKYHQYRKNKYITTPAELICMRYGYLDSLLLLKSLLSETEKQAMNNILNSITLVCESLEISYLQNTQPVNMLANFFGRIVSISRKNPCFIKQYPQFSLFLQETGEFRTLEDIYRTGKENNLNYYSDVVVRLFSFADETALKKMNIPDDMFRDLESWANNYLAMGMRYLQNKELAKIILSDQIVEDNAAAIIKSISLLNKRMMLLGMKHNVGGVFPAYKV